MSQRQKTMLGGTAVLSVSGILCKLIGMVFRIRLSQAIGSQGIGLYQASYSTYTLLLVLSSAGLPVAVSRMVAEYVSHGDEHSARRVFWTALGLLSVLGLALSALMALGSRVLAVRIGDVDARLGFMMLSPTVLIVAMMSAYRGYLQGHRQMMPTAISQVIEQLAKVVIAYPLAMFGMRQSVIHAAAYALLGITVGEGLALVFMMVATGRARRAFFSDAVPDAPPEAEKGSMLSRLIRIALPISLGAAIVPLVGTIDSAMTLNRLADAGFTLERARSLYGLQSGSVLSLLNVPTALAIAVAVSLVPSISTANALGNHLEVRTQSALSLRLAFLIGLPCALGMSLLSTPIVSLLYHSYPPEEIAIAGRLLSIGAFTIPLFILGEATTGVLQGLGYQKIPMYTLLLGAAFKTALNYILIGTPSVNIYGAPIASLTCYSVAAGLNLYFALRKTGTRFQWGDMLIRPALATLAMSAAVLLFIRFVGTGSTGKTLLGVFVGIAVFLAAAPLTGAVRMADLEQFPGGDRIAGLLSRTFRRKQGDA